MCAPPPSPPLPLTATVQRITTPPPPSPPQPALGMSLHVPLPPSPSPSPSTSPLVRIRIHYSTTPASGGIQWLAASQTGGGVHPFVYTQCQAILARTLFPCQDTPAVKHPFSIAITCPSPLVAVCSGRAVSPPPSPAPHGSPITFEYNQPVPVPAYLVAVVCGDLHKGRC